MITANASAVQTFELGFPLFAPDRVSYSEMTDAELVLACKGRDRDAFDFLVRRYESTVFSILYKLAPEWQDPADLVQEVFVRVWCYIDKLANPHSFRSWLKSIATNIFYDQLRRRQKQSTVSIDDPINASDGADCAAIQLVDPSRQPDELAENRQLSVAIEAAVSKLSKSARNIIELRELQGLSYLEIAELTNSPMGTVKSRIARARTSLQTWLLPYVNDTACYSETKRVVGH
jgi:RNA polymerase sigma-70 factor (ECF subfamily)